MSFFFLSIVDIFYDNINRSVTANLLG